MLSPFPRFGHNISILKTIYETITQPDAKGCDCVQICLGSMQSYNRRKVLSNDIEKCKEFLKKNNMCLYSHTPYVINLANEDTKSVDSLRGEVETVTSLNGSAVVHIGAKGTLNTVIKNVNSLNIKKNKSGHQPYPLLLENSAGEGTKLGSSFDELRKLMEGMDHNGVGICLDTAHAFAAGIAKYGTTRDVDKFFEDSEEFKEFKLLHLNDSKIPFGGKSDRHSCLGVGFIWGKWKDDKFIEEEYLSKILDNSKVPYPESLIHLIKSCKDRDIDVILETRPSIYDLQKLQLELK